MALPLTAAADADRPTPLVSVALPVYNGQQFLATAIESVLGQTLGDIDLIISDNASTDATGEIAARYVRMDRRVRYLRHAHNLGVNRNWSFAAQQARGRYLKWLSASDYLAPELLAICADRLDADPTAVLCFSHTQQVDTQGRTLSVFNDDFEVKNADPVERFLEVASRLCINSPMNAGLFRRDAVHAELPLGNYPGADLVLMAKIALHGRFVLLPEALLNRRAGDAYSTVQRTPLQIERMHNPDATQPRRLGETRRLLGYFSAALAGPISLADRFRVLIAASRTLYWAREEILQELAAPGGRRRKPI